MSENNSVSLEAFQEKIRSLKTTDDYSPVIESIRKDLGLPLKSDKNMYIEALLIEVAYICYPEGIAADAVLAALGLLKDFNNREDNLDLDKNTDAAKFLLTERCKKFLKESIYLDIVKVQGRFYGSYKELENERHPNPGHKKNPLDTALNTLEKGIDEHLNVIAKTLYESNVKELNEYLAASRQHIDKIGKKLNRPPLNNKRKTSAAAQTATETDVGGSKTNIGKSTITATFTLSDDDDGNNINVTIAVDGRKTKKTKELIEKIVAISFLCMVFIILAVRHIQNYDSFTQIPPHRFAMDALEEPVIERDPDKVCLYYKILVTYVTVILICLTIIVVLLRMIVARNTPNQSVKKKE